MLSSYLGLFEQLGVRCSNSSCRTTLAAVVRAFPWWLEHHLKGGLTIAFHFFKNRYLAAFYSVSFQYRLFFFFIGWIKLQLGRMPLKRAKTSWELIANPYSASDERCIDLDALAMSEVLRSLILRFPWSALSIQDL